MSKRKLPSTNSQLAEIGYKDFLTQQKNPLIEAINNYSMEDFGRIIKAYPELINLSNGVDGGYPIHYACNRPIQFIQAIIRNGADVNAADDKGYTALHVAVQCKNDVVIKFLLDSKADPEIKNNDRKTPQMIAAEIDRDQIMEIFEAYEESQSIDKKQLHDDEDRLLDGEVFYIDDLS